LKIEALRQKLFGHEFRREESRRGFLYSFRAFLDDDGEDQKVLKVSCTVRPEQSESEILRKEAEWLRETGRIYEEPGIYWERWYRVGRKPEHCSFPPSELPLNETGGPRWKVMEENWDLATEEHKAWFAKAWDELTEAPFGHEDMYGSGEESYELDYEPLK
jgi:hypothetical protein